jgi:hypothetical protein
MLSKRTLFTGDLYTRASWDEYWEGALKRSNENVGTVTTQTNTWYANYGVTDRVNVIAMVPYVWTDASQGVLHGIQGLQDLTLAAKYNFLERTPASAGTLRAIAVVSAGIPLTDYNPELPPLSIGSSSKRLSGRGTVNFQSNAAWFLNGSGAYTWRAHATLDRPYYYTDDEFVMSDEVDMPNVFDYVLSAGLMKPGKMLAGSFSQQRTLGGGDIRRQDMPFVSNRMNASRVGVMAMYPIPKLESLAFQFAYAYTVTGRNVGQAHTFTTGLLYLFGSAPR